jgi:hypothetical protein
LALLAAFWFQDLALPKRAEGKSSKTDYFTLIVNASETSPRKAFKKTRPQAGSAPISSPLQAGGL